MPRYAVKLHRESVIPLVIREIAAVEVEAADVAAAEDTALKAADGGQVHWRMSSHRTEEEMFRLSKVSDVRQLNHMEDGHA